MNLIPAIQEMERVIRVKQNEFERSISEYREGLKALCQLNTACENCGGTGRRLVHPLAEFDDPYEEECSWCRGTGKNT